MSSELTNSFATVTVFSLVRQQR